MNGLDLKNWRMRALSEIEPGSLVLTDDGALLTGQGTDGEFCRALRLTGGRAGNFVHPRRSESCLHFEGQLAFEAAVEHLLDWPADAHPWSHTLQIVIGAEATVITGCGRGNLEAMTLSGAPFEMAGWPRGSKVIRTWQLAAIEPDGRRVPVLSVTAREA